MLVSLSCPACHVLALHMVGCLLVIFPHAILVMLQQDQLLHAQGVMLLLAPSCQIVSWADLVAWILPDVSHQWA